MHTYTQLYLHAVLHNNVILKFIMHMYIHTYPLFSTHSFIHTQIHTYPQFYLHTAVHNNVINAFTPEANIWVAIVLVIASFMFFLKRMSLLFRTTRLLNDDKARFKSIWDALLREPNANGDLLRLQNLVQKAKDR
jgi:hypothetical protein